MVDRMGGFWGSHPDDHTRQASVSMPRDIAQSLILTAAWSTEISQPANAQWSVVNGRAAGRGHKVGDCITRQTRTLETATALIEGNKKRADHYCNFITRRLLAGDEGKNVTTRREGGVSTAGTP